MNRDDRHAGQDSTRRIGHRAGQLRFLRIHHGRQQEHEREQNHPLQDIGCHDTSS